MELKSIIDEILKKKKRPFSWLADQMGMTFDGFKLSLNNRSIKYRDIVLMTNILEVSPMVFFSRPTAAAELPGKSANDRVTLEQGELKQALKSCKELNAALKDQIKDKDKIIALISKEGS
ncbi:hypothetical protein [Pedobacter gandavensis]|uniref:XRE family transcriptional regulator n=1 Tax=Pedobacter gandavensis TaxID=2679963 RepID=A0ABR6EXX8_9SPHI|nr:hypothetical protein [Pedobacter gandavensis]MBB2150135.1 hypothetical protein [Pedobacter gandavensis]